MEELDQLIKETNYHQRSIQVREVLGKSPSWMIRWGTTLFFLIIMVLILGSSVISYNDIVNAEILISSETPPINVKANASRRISSLNVKPNQLVDSGMVLAVLENNAALKDFYYLKEKLKAFDLVIPFNDSLDELYPPNLNLGDFQETYGEFVLALKNYYLYLKLSPDIKESEILQEQLAIQTKRNFLLKEQRFILRQNMKLAEIELDRYKTLLEKGVIAEAEYDIKYKEYLEDKMRLEEFQTTLASGELVKSDYRSALLRSRIQATEDLSLYLKSLENAYGKLISRMADWERTYLLKSPISGKVTLFNQLIRNQSVTKGEVVFTIVPENIKNIIGFMKLPIRNSGKVKPNQKVIIKLENYPFEEWGSLKGTVRNISDVPNKSENPTYAVLVELSNLKTSSGKEIEFKSEMYGSAEIVVEELTILKRILYQFRRLLNAD